MNKPGFKTTEFWVTVGVQLIGVLSLAGIFSREEADAWVKVVEAAGGLIAMIVSAIAYSSSRGRVKAAEASKPVDCPPVNTEAGTARFGVVLGVLVLSMAAFYIGCAGRIPADKSVCATDPAASGSVICRIASDMGWTVEDVDNAILDATALSWAFDAVGKDDIFSLCDKVEAVVTLNVNVPMSRVVNILVDDAKKSKAVANILSRRLVYFDVPDIIKPYDVHLILLNLKHVRDQFK